MSLPDAPALETVWVEVAEDEVPIWEQAIGQACTTIGLFLIEPPPPGMAEPAWRVEGVKPCGFAEDRLAEALTLARLATGTDAKLSRRVTPAGGWLARTKEAFPEQRIGRFVIRGSHLPPLRRPGAMTLVLDAGVAFGSGEHASTRGCLLALTQVARRTRPTRILDLGTGSGVLAMAAATLLHRPVLATDIDPWSVRVAAENARTNQLGPLIRCLQANGWNNRAVRRGGPYDLVFANILARPLCAMAASLSAHLAPGGTVILAGLLARQARQVLAAHRRTGLHLVSAVTDLGWTTLVLGK